MFTVLFQRIPRCLFEPIAILGLAGLIFFLCRHWKKDKAETVLFALVVAFMIGWRMMMPINADRYALILIPVSIYFSVVAIEETVSFCRKYFRFPDCRLFLGMLMVLCGIKSFHSNTEDRQLFEMVDFLKKETRDVKRTVTVTANRDLSYFLGDQFEIRFVHCQGPLQFSALPKTDYCLMKLSGSQQPKKWHWPGFTELKKLRQPGGKSTFILWKRVSGQ